MENVTLEVKKRGEEKSNAVRDARDIPGVLYGHGIETTPIRFPRQLFTSLFRKAGYSTLIDCVVDSAAPVPVLVHEVQIDPITDAITHVDLLAVDVSKEMEVTVPIVFSGIAPAVKERGGVLLRQMDEMTIRCLPTALIHEMTVDLGLLKEFGDVLYAEDVPLPAGVELAEAPTRVVVSVKAPRVEGEKTTEEDAGDVSNVEVVQKGKEEKEEDAGEKKEREVEKKA